MLNVVQFLEALGASPNLSTTGYANAVEALGLEESARDARDAEGLNRLMGGRGAMRCMVVTPG